jgi:uncharacterized membrane protein
MIIDHKFEERIINAAARLILEIEFEKREIITIQECLVRIEKKEEREQEYLEKIERLKGEILSAQENLAKKEGQLAQIFKKINPILVEKAWEKIKKKKEEKMPSA